MIEAWLKRPKKINQRIGIQTFNGYQYFFLKKKYLCVKVMWNIYNTKQSF